jgi:hypothetical protein
VAVVVLTEIVADQVAVLDTTVVLVDLVLLVKETLVEHTVV